MRHPNGGRAGPAAHARPQEGVGSTPQDLALAREVTRRPVPHGHHLTGYLGMTHHIDHDTRTP